MKRMKNKKSRLIDKEQDSDRNISISYRRLLWLIVGFVIIFDRLLHFVQVQFTAFFKNGVLHYFFFCSCPLNFSIWSSLRKRCEIESRIKTHQLYSVVVQVKDSVELLIEIHPLSELFKVTDYFWIFVIFFRLCFIILFSWV